MLAPSDDLGERRPISLRMWDLKTQRSVLIFGRSNLEDDELRDFRYTSVGEWIVGQFRRSIRVLSRDGHDVLRITTAVQEDLCLSNIVVDQQKIMFTHKGDYDDSISQIDIVTGTVQERVVTFDKGEAQDFELVVWKNVLLVVRGDVWNGDVWNENYEEPVDHMDGIYAFDLHDFSQKHFLQGSYQSITKGSDGSDTVVAARCIRHGRTPPSLQGEESPPQPVYRRAFARKGDAVPVILISCHVCPYLWLTCLPIPDLRLGRR